MVTNEEKLSKFNQAIHHYAEEQRLKIEEELKKFKEKELSEAEDEVLLEAYHMIQKEMAQMRSNITKEMAHREMDARRKLLEQRKTIMNRVFMAAAEKLQAFAASPEYHDWVVRHCRELSGLFTAPDTVAFIREEDMKMAEEIRKILPNCQIEKDPEIRLGGLRVQSLQLGLVADETLDALLIDQQEWFEEHSGLQVQ